MLARLLARIAERTVIVLGDIMLDEYVEGQVLRISPEAPIPVLHFSHARTVLGGAGNVMANIAALGARAILIGVVGDDVAGSGLGAKQVAGIPNAELRAVTVPGRPTTVKTRFMSGSHQILRLDKEVTAPIDDAAADEILGVFESCLAQADAVVLSDYAKGVLSDRVLARAVAAARARGLPVIADPKRLSFAAYRNVSVLTPNEMEVAKTTGIEVLSNAAAEAAGRVALTESGADAVLVTRSRHGLTLVRPDGEALHLPTEARAVADVSGAGDTLVATLAVMLACGAELPEAAGVANVAAGIAVGKLGTATVDQAELVSALHRQELLAIDDKVVPLAVALEKVAAWRRSGIRTGFTNGCFDLIHPGHVRLLAKARTRCGRLIVGLNTDASVRRLKGSTRPLQSETARATVMASMGAVDLVVLFDEDTPLELIEALRPDFLFKGADYRLDQVVGADAVAAGGGRVVLIDPEAGFSTTAIVRRMNLPAEPVA